MARVIASLLGCVLLTGCADAPEDAQAAVMLDGFVVCEICALEIVGSDTLQAESDRGIVPGYPADIEVMPDGRIAAVFQGAGEPLWFGPDGTVTGPIGRLGDGPGEYRRPTTLLAVPDSLVVFESYGRVSVVDLETAGVRTLPLLPLQIADAVVLSWPDRIAVSYRLGPPIDSVSSIMMFDLSGEEPELVGEVEPWSQQSDNRSLHRRLIGAGTPNTFWALDYADYRIVHRDSVGRVIREARRNAEWAPDGTGDLSYGPSKAPPAWMGALHQDADGRVWTVARTPRADWEVAWTSRGITEIVSRSPDWGPRPDELWESRIEVFSRDLDSLLVSDVVPGLFEGFVSDGRLVRYTESDVGFPIIELVRVRLDDRTGPGSG